jgi:hypothetical protein
MHRLLVLYVSLFALLLLLSSKLGDESLDRPPAPGPRTLVTVQYQEPPEAPLPDQTAVPAAGGAESEWVTSGSPESIPLLIRYLQGQTHARVKSAALAEFAAMGAQARPAVPAILAALQDPESRIRVKAAATLIHMDVQSKAAIRTLKEELNAPAAADRAYAAGTIGQLVDPPEELGTSCWGPDPPPQVARPWVGKRLLPPLVEALEDPDENVRAQAAITLGLIGPEAKVALPALTRALKDPEGGVQNAASQAIRKLTGLEPPR